MTDKAVDYIKIKVFLYKYNPIFKTVPDKTNKNASELKRIQDQIKTLQGHLAAVTTASSAITKDMLLKDWENQKEKIPKISTINPIDYGNKDKGGTYSYFQTKNPNQEKLTSLVNFLFASLTETVQLFYDTIFFIDIIDKLIIYYINNSMDDAPAITRLGSIIHNVLSGESLIKSKNYTDIKRQLIIIAAHKFIQTVLLSSAQVGKDSVSTISNLNTQIKSLQAEEAKFKQGLSRVQRFEVELDEEKYFSKVDISDFVTDYKCSQKLHNEISWSVNLFNGTLDQKNMDKYFLVRGNSLINPLDFSANGALSYSTLADYETEDDNSTFNYGNEVSTINIAMNDRAKNVTTEVTQTASEKEKSDDISKRQPQILLSDLIQKFDFISCYIYKQNTPIDDTMLNFGASGQDLASKGIQEEVWMMQNGFSNEFNGFVISKTVTKQVGSLNTLSISGAGSFCLFDRTKVMYSPTLFTSSLYDQAELFDRDQIALFSNLYSNRKITEIINILLRDIYRIIPVTQDPLLRFEQLNNTASKPIIAKYQKEIRDFTNLQEAASKGTPADRDPRAKSSDYWYSKLTEAKANFKVQSQVSSMYGMNMSIYDKNAYAKLQSEMANIKQSYFFDMARIKIENGCNTNIFNIPPYLYSLVMKAKSFNYRDITSSQVNAATVSIIATSTPKTTIVNGSVSVTKGSLGPTLVNYMNTAYPSNIALSQVAPTSISVSSLTATTTLPESCFYGPVFMQVDVDQLKAYFLFLESGFSNFNPTLYTPNQILNEIMAASFLEIFETPTGALVVRTPKYNDTSSVLFSSQYNVLSTSYTDSIKNVISKEKLTYHPDLVKNIPFNIFGFTNGKLLAQYGLTETNASANPNVKFSTSTDSTVDVDRSMAIFNYARFFLELNNAAQKTSTFTVEYIPATPLIKDPITGELAKQSFGVGNLFFDEVADKLSYITSVEKSCQVGGVPVMSFTGTYVRDCFNSGNSTSATALEFRKLPELIELNKLFTTASTTSKNPTLGTGLVKGASNIFPELLPKPMQDVIRERTI